MRDQLRVIPHSHWNYDFFDFEVNGAPLLQQISIEVLYGSKPSEHRTRAVKANLLSTLRLVPGMPPHAKTLNTLNLLIDGDRAPLFGCAACCNDCEAVTVGIQRTDGGVIWKDFRFTPAADVREAFGAIPEPKWSTLLRAGPFWFDEREYRRAFGSAIDRLGLRQAAAQPSAAPGSFFRFRRQ